MSFSPPHPRQRCGLWLPRGHRQRGGRQGRGQESFYLATVLVKRGSRLFCVVEAPLPEPSGLGGPLRGPSSLQSMFPWLHELGPTRGSPPSPSALQPRSAKVSPLGAPSHEGLCQTASSRLPVQASAPGSWEAQGHLCRTTERWRHGSFRLQPPFPGPHRPFPLHPSLGDLEVYVPANSSRHISS